MAPMGDRRLGRLMTTLVVTAAVTGGIGANATSAAAAPVFGFNDNAVGQGVVSNADDASWLSDAGAGIARITLEWRWVERDRGVYDFRGYDLRYSGLLARGVRPLIAVMFAPSWAVPPTVPCDFTRDNCRYPPAKSHNSDWADMLGAVARRYPQAAGIELWNEPNVVSFWAPKPDVARYTELLKIGYQAVKAANPSMPVLSGGLGNFQTSDAAGNVAVRAFLSGIYANGG